MELRLLSLNIGRPGVIGRLHDQDVVSGIAKKPVALPNIAVRMLGLEGDGQADLTVHGGPDKAVYAYSADNWAWWQAEKALLCRPATFGENLTLSGADEADVAIGDRFAWGDAVLEVSQPRAPCFKLAMHTARPDVPGLMTLSGRCGWYFRVLQEGRAASHAMLSRIHRADAPTVRAVFRALFDPRVSRAEVQRAFDVPELASAWRLGLAKRLRQRPDSAAV